MGFTKITEEDIKNKGVVGLPDTPNLSTADMQAKFDELALTVIIPKINNLIAEIEAVTASESIGIVIDDEIGVEKNLQSAFSYLHELVKAIGVTGHSHENKEIIDSITEELLYELNEITVLLKDIESVSNEINGSETALATCKAVTDYVQELGGGDMTRAMYDANKNGIVDNSEMLGGKLPEYYQSAEDDSLETSSKNVVGAINELKITLDNVDVEGLSTMEQVEACTDPEQPVGAGAIQELNDSLQWFIDNGYLPEPYIEELIPKMTSNTSPSGVASASSTYTASPDTYSAYLAFDRNTSDTKACWMSTSVANSWLQYKFPSAVKVSKFKITNRYRSDNANVCSPKQFAFQASNTGNTDDWHDLGTFTNTNNNSVAEHEYRITNSEKYLYYRLYFNSGNDSTRIAIGELQMYGVK